MRKWNCATASDTQTHDGNMIQVVIVDHLLDRYELSTLGGGGGALSDQLNHVYKFLVLRITATSSKLNMIDYLCSIFSKTHSGGVS